MRIYQNLGALGLALVVVLTNSADPTDIKSAYEAGANFLCAQTSGPQRDMAGCGTHTELLVGTQCHTYARAMCHQFVEIFQYFAFIGRIFQESLRN